LQDQSNEKKVINPRDQPIEPKNFSKKYVKYLKRVTESKTRMGFTQRNLQALPKFLQKLPKHQIKEA
jgi:hypothetical protein